MLRATTKEQKERVIEILAPKWKTCCYFPFNPDSEDDYDDRIYFDGNISFDKMAEIVDLLRACNPDKK